MQLIKPDINIDFVGRRKLAVIFSVILILIGMGSLIAKGGPDYGIDFAGGTLVQVKFEADTSPTAIKEALESLNLGGLVVQTFGDEANEFLIRAQATSDELKGLGKQVGQALDSVYGEGKSEIRRV